MSQTLQVNNTEYVKASVAARAVGYTSDYVGRLAREKKIAATRVGRQWFIDLESLKKFIANSDKKKSERREKLRSVRKVEHRVHQNKTSKAHHLAHVQYENEIKKGVASAVVATMAVVMSGIGIGVFATYGVHTPAVVTDQVRKHADLEALAVAVYTGFSPASNQSVAASPVARGVAVEAVPQDSAEQVVTDSETYQAENTGLIVMDGDISDETIAAVRDSFSDEVAVEIDESAPDTGLITPVFKERSGDTYRFLMVPVSDDS